MAMTTQAVAGQHDVGAPIVADLATREGTFGPDRCGGLMMSLMATDHAADRPNHPEVRLALRGFLESSIERSDRDESIVLEEMSRYARAYLASFGEAGATNVAERDATYCRALVDSIGRLP
ncbi:MAG: hypothetical protein AAF264_09710 [Pseudomonadota bacterium]